MNKREKLKLGLYLVIGLPLVLGILYSYFGGIFGGIKVISKTDWIGSFYNNYEEKERPDESDDFDSLADCQEWGQKIKDGRGDEYPAADFDCSTGCEYSDDKIVSGKRVKTYACTQLVGPNDEEEVETYTAYKTAKGETIYLRTPKAGEKVSESLDIFGKIKPEWADNNQFTVELLNKTGKSLEYGWATAQTTVDDNGYVIFSAFLLVENPPYSETAKLVLTSGDYSDSLEIEITF